MNPAPQLYGRRGIGYSLGELKTHSPTYLHAWCPAWCGMNPLTAKQIIKVLTENGFRLSRQKGSHRIYTNKSGIMVPVPMHAGNKPVFIGTFLAIIKQSKIPKNKFRIDK